MERDKNREHYTSQYAELRVEAVVQRAGDLSFLYEAVRNRTSWHGLYRDGFMGRLQGKSVLELGSGDGLNALFMARLGARVTAVEIAEPAVRVLNEASRRLELDVQAVHGDFLALPFPTFDFIVGKAFLHHLDHNLEDRFLRKCAALLKPDGEARFQEPAVNSRLLDALRWLTPVPGRPSILNWRSFRAWKEEDPHPKRDNSGAHYAEAGRRYFASVQVIPFAGIERFRRLIPDPSLSLAYAEWALRVEPRYLPLALRRAIARSQTIIYSQPKSAQASTRSEELPAAS